LKGQGLVRPGQADSIGRASSCRVKTRSALHRAGKQLQREDTVSTAEGNEHCMSLQIHMGDASKAVR